jgi:hypothetical protein
MKLKIREYLFVILMLLSTIAYLCLCTNIEAQRKFDSKIIMTIERHGCFGACPIYSAQIYADGTVIYRGKEFVEVKGTKQYKISEDKIKELVNEFQRINYFSLKDHYETNIEDGASTTSSILLEGRLKKIVNEAGPKELYELENKIEEIAGLKKFIETLKARIETFGSALLNDPTAKGIIINYGTAKKIAERESDIRLAFKFLHYDINRVKFVRRNRNKGIKTEFQIVKIEP